MPKNKPYDDYDMISYIESMVIADKYLEALVIVSSYIEIFLAEVVMAAAYLQAKDTGMSRGKIRDAVNTNTFAANIKMAICLGIINKKLYNDLQSFRIERNSMVHDFMSLRSKTNKHLASVIKKGKKIYIEILVIRRDILPKALFGS
jgi:hypothetical protein